MFKNIAIIGSNGAIGSAFINELSLDDNVENIFAFSRKGNLYNSNKIFSYKIDIEDEDSVKEAANIAFENCNIDLILVTTGILHNENIMPEKSLKEISMSNMEKIFRINSFGPALIMKHFLARISKENKSIFAAISARVGSISDNNIGGWYSYRASKAALNMLIKTTSIEVKRKFKNSIVIGLHPGTVDSFLSKPFQTNISKDSLFTPEYSAKKLLSVLNNLEIEDTGKCFAYDGEEILP